MINREFKKMEFKEVPAGVHLCQLTRIKDCEVKELTKAEGKLVTTGETKPGFRFVFKTDDGGYLLKTVRKSTSNRSGLYKLMQDLYDSRLKEIKFNKAGYALDPDYFFDLIEELEGAYYMVTCVKHGQYTNITEVELKEPIVLYDREACAERRKHRHASAQKEEAEQMAQAQDDLPEGFGGGVGGLPDDDLEVPF